MLNAIKGLPFEDENDIDKQFWLLDQKIKGFGKTIEKIKSQETLISTIEQILIPFKIEIDIQNINFSSYYLTINSNFYYYQSPRLIDDNKGNYIKFDFKNYKDINLPYDFHEIKLESVFSDFNRVSLNDFKYSYQVYFYFHKKYFEIKYEEFVISLLYNEEPKESQIKILLNHITKDHIKFIDQQLSNNK